MRVALLQFNPIVGNISSNAQRILEFAQRAHNENAQLLIAPELALCGYSAKDLLLRDDFLDSIDKALKDLAAQTPIPIILGAPIRHHYPQTWSKLWNAAVCCFEGKVSVVARKTLLPNYDVFDEPRYFYPHQKGDGDNIFEFNGIRFGISICEDAWNDKEYWKEQRYQTDPFESLVEHKADIFINLAASPFTINKPQKREEMLAHLARRHSKMLLAVGQVGANDQWIFDGSSVVINEHGETIVRYQAFVEHMDVVDISTTFRGLTAGPMHLYPHPVEMESLYQALVLGIRDYVRKCGAKGVVLGLSGGIDSALVAVLAAEALGPENVVGIRMPSAFSSPSSLTDAEEFAQNLGIKMETIPIEAAVNAMRAAVLKSSDITDQNLQARVRGMLLMAYSNESGFLVLATGNKSEIAAGYCTLYGDLCGALAPLADIYKTQVWELSKYINTMQKDVIPKAIIEKVPTAELKANQRDEDTLLPYHRLDKILIEYVDNDRSLEDIVKITKESMHDVIRTVHLVQLSEYKRRQIPLSLRVSERVFGDSRRLPIAAVHAPLAN